MRVSASHTDRWLRWHRRQLRIEANERALAERPDDIALYEANEALKRQRDRWKVPRGWRSWDEIGKYLDRKTDL